MSSLGMCALFYSAVTTTPAPANGHLPNGNLTNHVTRATTTNPALNRSQSTAPGLYSYVSSPKQMLDRYVFGIHPKTKRCLAEEAESGDDSSLGAWFRDGVNPNECDAYGYTPLLNAAALGRLNAVRELVKVLKSA